MVMRFLRGGRDRLDNVPREIVDMLADGRHSFDVATSYLLSGGDREAIGADLRETDRRVNEGERQIRRDLLVHASVRMPPAPPPRATAAFIARSILPAISVRMLRLRTASAAKISASPIAKSSTPSNTLESVIDSSRSWS